MTDRETFEVRLHAAVHGYVDRVTSDLDPLELARAIAAAEPRHHEFATTLGSRRVAVPRVAWVLLVAALLAALIGGTLFVGSQMQRKVPAVVPPVELGFACPPDSTPDEPGPVDQARPPISYGEPMAFDSRAGRIVLLADGQTWTFDVCANTWTGMHPNQEPSDPGPIYQPVYDADSDLTVAIVGDRVWAYDLESDAWTAKGRVPVSLQGQTDLVHDVTSGLVVVLSRTRAVETDPWELWTYDVETDTWTPIRQARGPAVPPDHAYQWLAYDPSVDRLVWYELTSQATWLFDMRTGTWSRSGAVTPRVSVGFGNSGGEMAYDEATHRTVVFSRGRFIAYDAATDRWDVLVEGWLPESSGASMGSEPANTDRLGSSMVYDPANQRFIVYGGEHPTDTVWVQGDDVLAFDPVTREWSVLLAASKELTWP